MVPLGLVLSDEDGDGGDIEDGDGGGVDGGHMSSSSSSGDFLVVIIRRRRRRLGHSTLCSWHNMPLFMPLVWAYLGRSR